MAALGAGEADCYVSGYTADDYMHDMKIEQELEAQRRRRVREGLEEPNRKERENMARNARAARELALERELAGDASGASGGLEMSVAPTQVGMGSSSAAASSSGGGLTPAEIAKKKKELAELVRIRRGEEASAANAERCDECCWKGAVGCLGVLCTGCAVGIGYLIGQELGFDFSSSASGSDFECSEPSFPGDSHVCERCDFMDVRWSFFDETSRDWCFADKRADGSSHYEDKYPILRQCCFPPYPDEHDSCAPGPRDLKRCCQAGHFSGAVCNTRRLGFLAQNGGSLAQNEHHHGGWSYLGSASGADGGKSLDGLRGRRKGLFKAGVSAENETEPVTDDAKKGA